MAFSLDDLTGTLSESDYGQAPQVKGIGKDTYQIPGLGEYTSTLGGLAGQVPGSPDYVGSTQGDINQQRALQTYLQQVALGQAPSAADIMLRNAQQQAGRQMQSQAVSTQGANPALAMRQLFQGNATVQSNLAGQSAQQKLQEQESFGRMAQVGSQALVQQEMARQQQQFNDTMRGIQAKADLAGGIFNANRTQTSFNIEQAKNQQAFEMYQRGEVLGRIQDDKRNKAAMIKGIVTGVGTAAGAAIGSFGGPMGTALGASLGGSLTGGLLPGGGGGFDPRMLAALAGMQQRGDGSLGGNPTQAVAGNPGSEGYTAPGVKVGR